MDKAEFEAKKAGIGQMSMADVARESTVATDAFNAALGEVLPKRKPTSEACAAFREASLTAQQWMDLKVLHADAMVKAGKFPQEGLESYRQAVGAEAEAMNPGIMAARKKCDIYPAPALKQ